MGRSGVSVATMIRSMSAAVSPASARAARAEAAAICEVVSPAAAMRRSRIPVRLKIHSSDVSTNLERSALVRIFSGV